MPPEWEGSQNQATYGSDTGSVLKEDAAAAEVPPVSQEYVSNLDWKKYIHHHKRLPTSKLEQ